MTPYSRNVLELPALRFRAGVYDNPNDATRRILGLILSHGLEAEVVVHSGERAGTAQVVATGLGSRLDLPCLRLGPGIRELVRFREILLVVDALDRLDSVAAALDWLMAFKANSIILATPTGHRHAIEPIAKVVDTVICPNIRCSWDFTTGAAYATADRTSGIPSEPSSVQSASRSNA